MVRPAAAALDRLSATQLLWLVVGIALNAMNIAYSPINIMPG